MLPRLRRAGPAHPGVHEATTAAAPQEPPPSHRAAAIAWAWPVVCLAGFLALCWRARAFVTDDAWITVRYAENLADGYGFAWNSGGPRVEGFSNPLLVAVEALGHALGISSIGVSRVAGVGCGVALVALIHRVGPSAVGSTATRVGLALTALFPPLALWAVGGLETLPATLAITAGVLALCRVPGSRRDVVCAAVAFAVLPWLRPEGLLVALAVALAAEGPGLLGAPRRAPASRLIILAGPALASQVLLEAARLTVYGHLLPNSVLYKAGAGGTFDVVGKFALASAPVIAAAAAGLLVARGRQRLLAVPPLVYLLGALGTRDSADAFSRFLLPTWPQWALLAGLAVAATHATSIRAGRALALVAGTGLTVIAATAGLRELPKVERFGAHYATCKQLARNRAAAWLRSNTAPAAVFSISDAGLVPARAGRRTAIDQFALNEPVIQRSGPLPVDRRVRYVFDRRPDVLVLASHHPDRLDGVYPTDRAIADDRHFARYRLADVASGDGNECAYNLFLYRRVRRAQHDLAE